MIDPNSQQLRSHQEQGPPSPQGPQANYQFTPDELRVLKECNRASFYERSLPISGMLGAATFYAVKAGYLSGGRYGPTPKVCGALLLGYFIGKISYQGKCAQMLMQLPNSPLGEMLRQRQKGSFMGQIAPNQGIGGPGLSLPPFSSATDTYSDEANRSGASLNMDTSRPANAGLDDIYRPSLDSTPPNFNYDDVKLPLEPPKQGATYDELRKKNREEYQQRQSPPPPQMPAPYNRPPVVRPPESSSSAGNDEPARRNKYGDIWSETK